MCERGRAQHGANSESFEAVGREWGHCRALETTLGETLDYLRHCHRRAPFLFLNGNTFADIACTFSDYPFAELLNGLCASADFKPGDRVRTFRGSTRGVIVRVQPDGRIVWRVDSGGELLALPEALLREAGS